MFEVNVKETYCGGPNATREKVNCTGLMVFSSIDETARYIQREVSMIYRYYNVIREERVIEGKRLIVKVLFDHPNGHGRIIRKFTTFVPNPGYRDPDEDSLI